MSKLLVNWTSYFVSSPTQSTERLDVGGDGDEGGGIHQRDEEGDDDSLRHYPSSSLPTQQPSQQHQSQSATTTALDKPAKTFSSLVESGTKVWEGAWGGSGGAGKIGAVHPSELAMSVLVRYLVRSHSNKQQQPPPLNGGNRRQQQQPISESCARLIAEFICEREEVAVISSESAMPISCSPRGLHACDDAIPTSTVGEGGGPCLCLAASTSCVFVGSGEGVAQYDAALTERRGVFRIGHVVTAVAVSEDGTCCATGGTDGCVSLWSTVFADQPLFFEGHSDWVTFVAFASIPTEEVQQASPPPTTAPPLLSSTPNAPKRRQVILSGSDDGTVIMWSLQGEILSVLEYSLGIGIRAMSVSQIPVRSIDNSNNYTATSTTFHTSIALAAEKPSVHLYIITPTTCSIRAAGVIHDAHAGTLTALAHIPSLGWIASSGEDEVVTVSSLDTMVPLYKCRAFVSKRRCVSFMNTVTSIVVVSQPPESSVLILVACASDGGVLQWIIDPRDKRCHYFKTLKLQIGNLVSMSKMMLPL